MGKQESKGTTTKVVVLSPEELQKLTPEELIAYTTALSDQHASLQEEASDLEEAHDKQVAKNKKLETELAGKTKELKKQELPTFDVDADEENDIEEGTYQFTCPTFHWDDNSIIDVRDLMAEGKDKKAAEKAQAILGHLVARKSGIIKRKED